MAGDVAQPVAEVRAQLLADPAHAGAEGALEVEVLDQRQRRVDRSGDVVARRVDRSAEVRREGRVALAEETGGEAEGEPAGEARQRGGHQDADACLVLQPRRLEGEADDQQRHREADAGERTAGQGVAQADALRQPPPAEAHARPRAGEDAEGLADDEAEHDAPHQPRPERVAEDAVAQVDAGVGQREDGYDDVAGRGVQRLLQALVDGDGAGQRPARRRCTPGIGDCRNARKLRAASSTSDRRGSRAGTSRPLSMPAIEACTPDSRVANHSTSTTST